MGSKKPEASQPILVAVDFSAHSAKALLWAARAAECFRAPLVVVHVVHDPGSAPGYYHQPDKKKKKYLRRMKEAAAEMMNEFLVEVRKTSPDIAILDDLDCRLVSGLPVTRILEIAKRTNARMIVMGSRGRTGLPHLLLGSKAEKVTQLSPIPVTIVKDSSGDKGKK
ncbi:MAG: universal stress protein [bacterium]|nr:universal stress protein [bacterium]